MKPGYLIATLTPCLLFMNRCIVMRTRQWMSAQRSCHGRHLSSGFLYVMLARMRTCLYLDLRLLWCLRRYLLPFLRLACWHGLCSRRQPLYYLDRTIYAADRNFYFRPLPVCLSLL